MAPRGGRRAIIRSVCLTSARDSAREMSGCTMRRAPRPFTRSPEHCVLAASGQAAAPATTKDCEPLASPRESFGFRFVVYGVACFAPSAHGLKDDLHRGRSCLSELHMVSRLSLYSLPFGLEKVLRLLHLTDHLFDFCD